MKHSFIGQKHHQSPYIHIRSQRWVTCRRRWFPWLRVPPEPVHPPWGTGTLHLNPINGFQTIWQDNEPGMEHTWITYPANGMRCHFSRLACNLSYAIDSSALNGVGIGGKIPLRFNVPNWIKFKLFGQYVFCYKRLTLTVTGMCGMTAGCQPLGPPLVGRQEAGASGYWHLYRTFTCNGSLNKIIQIQN